MPSSQEPRAALVTPEDQSTIMGHLDLNKYTIRGEDLVDSFVQAQEVFMTAAQYSHMVREVQMVCDHTSQIIALQKQVTNLYAKQFLPPCCNDATCMQQIELLRHELNEAQQTLRVARTDQKI
jgi:hypothetical protein